MENLFTSCKEKIILALLFLFLGLESGFAHFGILIPSDTMINRDGEKKISLLLSFSHPFERAGMEMRKPKQFNLFMEGKKIDLLNTLKEMDVFGAKGWSAKYWIKRPGVYHFAFKPVPYWEPAEECYIIHYTKTVISAFGDEEGWDKELGLKTEIVPLSRPFGLYQGNVFQGIVKKDGKPVPYSVVEFEYLNQDRMKAPNDYMITQTTKADQNGVFTISVPKAGWWGFAALNSADYKISHNGVDKDVELGAVLWVKFIDWQKK